MVEKTGVLALRIGERDLSELKKLARMEHLSVAALVSNVLKSYIDWDYMAAKVGMIPCKKRLSRKFLIIYLMRYSKELELVPQNDSWDTCSL